MRSRVSRSRVGHDRWLVSYADFITLLFAFFVVLYAFARADQKKQVQVAQAVNTALNSMGGIADSDRRAKTEPPPSKTPGEELLSPMEIKYDLTRIQHDLSLALAKEISNRTVALELGRDGLVISLREAGFFDSGSAIPKPQTMETLRIIATRLGDTPYELRIEGHTDNVPIHTAQFDSNWELSSARATHIARLFLGMKTISPDRISAAGYAEYHPVASNDTAQGRAENRRVDLVVLPRTKLDFASPGGVQASGPWQKIADVD